MTRSIEAIRYRVVFDRGDGRYQFVSGGRTTAATKVTLTSTDAVLVPSTGYTTWFGYSNTGLPNGQSDPADGGLPQENIETGYDNFAEPIGLTSTGGATWTYVSAIGYSEYSQPRRYTMPTASGTIRAAMGYDAQTKQLTNIRTTDSTTFGDVDNLTYTYGNSSISKGAGLLTKVVDKQNAATVVDTQCAAYDYAGLKDR